MVLSKCNNNNNSSGDSSAQEQESVRALRHAMPTPTEEKETSAHHRGLVIHTHLGDIHIKCTPEYSGEELITYIKDVARAVAGRLGNGELCQNCKSCIPLKFSISLLFDQHHFVSSYK